MENNNSDSSNSPETPLSNGKGSGLTRLDLTERHSKKKHTHTIQKGTNLLSSIVGQLVWDTREKDHVSKPTIQPCQVMY